LQLRPLLNNSSAGSGGRGYSLSLSIVSLLILGCFLSYVVFKSAHGVWRRCGEAASAGFSAAALYSVYNGLYSEAVVSSVASAVALAEVGQFKEAVQYVQKAAKTL
jgi:hypothetical protein